MTAPAALVALKPSMNCEARSAVAVAGDGLNDRAGGIEDVSSPLHEREGRAAVGVAGDRLYRFRICGAAPAAEKGKS